MPVQNLEIKPLETNKKEFPPIKAGLYQVQVADITDSMRRPYGAPADAEKTEKFITFHFAILDNGEFKGRHLLKDVRPITPFPPSGSVKPSWLWRVVSAIYGHDFTKEEASGFNAEILNSLIGRQLKAMVNRTEKEYKGTKRVYNNITDVLPVDEYKEPVEKDEVGEIQLNDNDLPF